MDERNEKYRLDARERERRLSSRAQYVARNKDKLRDVGARYYAGNRGTILAKKVAYHKARYESAIKPYRDIYNFRPDVIERRKRYTATYSPLHYAKNKGRYVAKVIKRRELTRKAMPAWADQKQIESMYEKARELTLTTGVQHEVDHIVPLNGKRVCGLHVHNNLQILTKEQNRKKFNRLLDEIC